MARPGLAFDRIHLCHPSPDQIEQELDQLGAAELMANDIIKIERSSSQRLRQILPMAERWSLFRSAANLYFVGRNIASRFGNEMPNFFSKRSSFKFIYDEKPTRRG